MQPITSPAPKVTHLPLKRSLLLVAPVATLAAILFYGLVALALSSILKGVIFKSGDAAATFMNLVTLFIFFPVIVVGCILFSSVTAWLVLRRLRIARAGLIATFSAIILGVIHFIYVYKAGSTAVGLLVTAVSFIIIFEIVALLLLGSAKKAT